VRINYYYYYYYYYSVYLYSPSNNKIISNALVLDVHSNETGMFLNEVMETEFRTL